MQKKGGVKKKARLLDVLVLGVNDLSQVLAIDFLLENPHLDLVVKVVESADVAADNLGDGRTPKKKLMVSGSILFV